MLACTIQSTYVHIVHLYSTAVAFIWNEDITILACILGLQVDRLEDELYQEQEKFKAITEELEQTFAEMSGY